MKKRLKCKLCGKYQIKQKEIGTAVILEDIEVSQFHLWKWCNLKNNWCRNVAGKCDFVPVEKDYLQGVKFKMTAMGEL